MFTHLHVHTEYSALDGMCKIEEYVKFLKGKGETAACITDHGNINGAVNFMQACEAEGLKAIIGCEFYVAQDHEKRENWHLTAIAKNLAGYRNLCKLCTVASLEKFYYKPRIDFELLENHKEGLIVLSGCLAGVFNRPFLQGNLELAYKNLVFLKETFGEDFYAEIMPIDLDDQRRANLELVKISKKLKIKTVATNDAHYIHPTDQVFQDMLLCSQDKTTMEDTKRFKFDVKSLYLADEAQIKEMFKANHKDLDVKQALESTQEIVNKCESYSLKGANIMPKVKLVKGRLETNEKYLSSLCKEAMLRKKLDKRKEYQKRLKEELSQIVDKGFVDYFLIVQDVIKWARSKDILVGPGRGSSAGSLVCFLLGITGVDPIKHGTLFFRFIDPNRNDLPDIDIDFEDARRGEVKDYLSDKYGRENVADVGTFGKLKGKVVLQDICRIHGVPLKEVEEIKRYIPTPLPNEVVVETSLASIFTQFEACKKFAVKYPHIVEAAVRLEGQIKQFGVHPAGLIITDKPVVEYCPIEARGKDKKPCTGFDYRNAAYLGLLKMDILGLNFLTVINKTLHSIKKKINLYEIPLDDKGVYKDLAERECVGVFQFETHTMSKLSRQIHVDNFDEIVACNTLVRPGPMRSGSTKSYIEKKHGRTPIEFGNKYLEEITKETKGELLYQEQIMMLVRNVGGFDWKDVNLVRKAIAKSEGSEKMRKWEETFVAGAMSRGFTETKARKLWDEVTFHGAYGFNKSHAVAYSMVSYWCAWLKHYYPNEYMLNFINYSTEEKRIFAAMREFKRLGYSVNPPRVNKPSEKMILAGKKSVNIGLTHVKGFGDKVIEELLKVKGKTLQAWTKRISKRIINSRIKKTLVMIGYFEPWGYSTKHLIDYFKLEFSADEPQTEEDWLYEKCSIIFCDDLLKRYEDFLLENIANEQVFDAVAELDIEEESEMRGQTVILKGVMDGIEMKDKGAFEGIKNLPENMFCISNFFDGTGYVRISFYPKVYRKYEKEIHASKDSGPIIIRGQIGPDRIYVHDMINVKLWSKGEHTDNDFVGELTRGIKNQAQSQKTLEDLRQNIDVVRKVRFCSLREHAAKNGMMAFAIVEVEGVRVELVVWAQAFARWKPLLFEGSVVSMRFSEWKDGKFYLDQITGRVSKQ